MIIAFLSAVVLDSNLVWTEILQICLSCLAIASGLFFVLAGSIGVLRFPDFYTRLHAAGMTDTLGAELILIGLILQSGFTQTSLKLLMIGFFLLLTSPTATHAIAHSAHTANLKPKLESIVFLKSRGIDRDAVILCCISNHNS